MYTLTLASACAQCHQACQPQQQISESGRTFVAFLSVQSTSICQESTTSLYISGTTAISRVGWPRRVVCTYRERPSQGEHLRDVSKHLPHQSGLSDRMTQLGYASHESQTLTCDNISSYHPQFHNLETNVLQGKGKATRVPELCFSQNVASR
jgi:hypothetical protein